MIERYEILGRLMQRTPAILNWYKIKSVGPLEVFINFYGDKDAAVLVCDMNYFTAHLDLVCFNDNNLYALELVQTQGFYTDEIIDYSIPYYLHSGMSEDIKANLWMLRYSIDRLFNPEHDPLELRLRDFLNL